MERDPLERALAAAAVAVVVPAYEAAGTLASTLAGIPAWVARVVVVDDGSGDATSAEALSVAAHDPRIAVVRHDANRGVGAAMRTGYARALADGAGIVAKMDADGQMDPAALAQLVLPVALGRADYAKGNRFVHARQIRSMPPVRLVGNAALSLLSKLSTGYWNLLDPTNGYTAASREALEAVRFERLDDGYFFETSMLLELGLARAVCVDVPIPARYGDESSHLSVARSLFEFAAKHARGLMRRVAYRYFVSDFSAASVTLVAGVVLAAFGTGFGLHHWSLSSTLGVPATAGTVMVAAFTTATGLACLGFALAWDARTVPVLPRTPPRIGVVPPA